MTLIPNRFSNKHDGFRTLAVIEHGQCRFFSRKKHRLTVYRGLRDALVKEVTAEFVIIDSPTFTGGVLN